MTKQNEKFIFRYGQAHFSDPWHDFFSVWSGPRADALFDEGHSSDEQSWMYTEKFDSFEDMIDELLIHLLNHQFEEIYEIHKNKTGLICVYLQAPMQERGEYVSWISSRGEFCYKQDEEYLLAEFKDIKKVLQFCCENESDYRSELYKMLDEAEQEARDREFEEILKKARG